MSYTTTDSDDLATVESAADIPQFATEAEEHAFWSTHTPSAALMTAARADPASRLPEAALPPVRPNGGTVSISLKIERDLLRDLRELAERRGIGYQTLLKRFVIERLYEERQRETARQEHQP